jgi:hypothetical protein
MECGLLVCCSCLVRSLVSVCLSVCRMVSLLTILDSPVLFEDRRGSVK